MIFVVDRDQRSRQLLLSGLTRRFGADFTVAGEPSPATALAGPPRLVTSCTTTTRRQSRWKTSSAGAHHSPSAAVGTGC